MNVTLSKIYILKNLIPEVLETMDPPRIVKNNRSTENSFEIIDMVIPELLILLKITKRASKKSKSLIKKKNNIEHINAKINSQISS